MLFQVESGFSVGWSASLDEAAIAEKDQAFIISFLV